MKDIKRIVSVALTKTAIGMLDDMAADNGLTRSSMVEVLVRRQQKEEKNGYRKAE
jgi:hypothetical protein